MREPGVFVALEGPDGAGKSTQALLLAQWLRTSGWAVTTCADPGGTAVGDALRVLLLESRKAMTAWCEALLFMASRAQLLEEVIAPALSRGEVVLTDRFLLSTVVYQGYAGGLDVEQLWQIGRLSARVEPELTLVLDVPVEQSRARRGRVAVDRFESRPEDFQARVRAGFRREAERQPDRIRLIDGTAPVVAVQESIRQAVSQLLPARGEGGASGC